MHISLLPKPSSFSLPSLMLRRPLNVECLQDLRDELAHLHDGNVLPDARAGAVAKLENQETAVSNSVRWSAFNSSLLCLQHSQNSPPTSTFP